MSHFTVLVLSEDETDLDELLEPYDESHETDPYWSLECETPQEHWLYRTLLEKGAVTEDVTMADFMHACITLLNEEDKDDGVERKHLVLPAGSAARISSHGYVYKIESDGSLYSASTYNPRSKWDYWRVGGRWSGGLKLKQGASALAEVEKHWDSPDDVQPGWCDQAYKRDIDIEGMRDEAATKARAQYEQFAALKAIHGELPDASWLELDHNSQEFTDARTKYWAHPLIKAMKEAELIGVWGAFPHDEFGFTLDEFVTRARLRVMAGYATLDGLRADDKGGTPGTWMAKGSMGWWGIGSDTVDSEQAYLIAVNKVIDDAPDDTVFTFIDCHI